MKISILQSITITFLVYFLILSYIPYSSIQKDFQPYYDTYMFFVESNCNETQYEHPTQIIIKFGDLSYYLNASGHITHIAGLTRPDKRQTIITIDTPLWNSYSKNDRMALMFHELSHALFLYPDLRDIKYRNHFMYYAPGAGSMNIFEYYRQLDQFTTMMCKDGQWI